MQGPGWAALPVRPEYSLLLAVVVFVEVAAHLAGLTFDVSTLPASWQFLDPYLLARDLLRSLWYLHSQPPAFNLFLGLVLKLTERHAPVVFHAAFLGIGWALCVGVLRLAEMLGATRPAATAAAVFLAVSPAFVLYEHWLFYTLPEAALLVWTAVGASSLARTGTRGSALAFSGTAALLCLTRSLYHLAFLGAVLGAVMFVAPRTGRVLRRAGMVPVIVVLAVYAKNLLLFGTFAGSSWMGMNFAKMTIGYLNMRERAPMVQSGVLSPISLIEPFSSVDRYPLGTIAPWGPPDVPATVSILKTNGSPNMNYGGLIGLSKLYQVEAWKVLRIQPSAYLFALHKAWWIYWWSPTVNKYLDPNRQRIGEWNRWWNRYVLGVVPPVLASWTVIAASLAAVLEGLRIILGGRSSLQARAAALVAILSIVYVAVIGNLLEVDENNRFRFATDPLTLALLAVLLSEIAPRKLLPSLLHRRQGNWADAPARRASRGRER